MNIPTDFLTPTDFEEFANKISGILSDPNSIKTTKMMKNNSPPPIPNIVYF